MPKITVHGGASYEPGHEPPGWTPPEDTAEAAQPGADAPAAEEAVAAKPPPAAAAAKRKRTLKEQLEGNGGGG